VPKRFALPDHEYSALKTKVLQRDRFRCRVCRSTYGVSVHHIQFRSDGGGDFSFNLVVLCQGCHASVHGRIPNKFIVILAKGGNPETLPDADVGLVFKKYPKVQKRVRWKPPK